MMAEQRLGCRNSCELSSDWQVGGREGGTHRFLCHFLKKKLGCHFVVSFKHSLWILATSFLPNTQHSVFLYLCSGCYGFSWWLVVVLEGTELSCLSSGFFSPVYPKTSVVLCSSADKFEMSIDWC